MNLEPYIYVSISRLGISDTPGYPNIDPSYDFPGYSIRDPDFSYEFIIHGLFTERSYKDMILETIVYKDFPWFKVHDYIVHIGVLEELTGYTFIQNASDEQYLEWENNILNYLQIRFLQNPTKLLGWLDTFNVLNYI